jgi:hypothetical protein
VWTKDSVHNFVESWERRPGRPPTRSADLDWALFSDAPPDPVLIAGLAFLVAAGFVALVKRRDSFTAILKQPVSTLPDDAPREAAQVLDLTRRLEEANQRLRLPKELGTRVERQARRAG